MAALVRSWPPDSARLAAPYLRAGPASGRVDEWSVPYWLQLPVWEFQRAPPPRRRHVSRRFLGDVLWAQFCLFLFVRIQDDVFDNQGAIPRMLFVANEFVMESERVFAKHLKEERFWRFFRASVLETSRGILEVDARQRGGAMRARAFSAYSRVSSIFNVGSAAVVIACGRDQDLRPIRRFMDEMAIAGQLLDDIADLNEDRAAGRLNAAAQWLTSRRGAHSLEALLNHVSERLRRARRALAPLGFEHAEAYFREAEESLSTLGADIRILHLQAAIAAADGRPRGARATVTAKPSGRRASNPAAVSRRRRA